MKIETRKKLCWILLGMGLVCYIWALLNPLYVILILIIGGVCLIITTLIWPTKEEIEELEKQNDEKK